MQGLKTVLPQRVNNSVCFSFLSKKPHHSKPSDGDVQKFNAADAGEEPLKEPVVLKEFHEYY